MSKVISIADRPIKTEVNGDVVEELERLLALARDGQILGMAWIGLQPDARPDVGWTVCPDGFSYGLGIVGLSYKYGQGAWEE
jgi:hypothetical protein